MLAGEVRLEVVARTRMNGRKEVGSYLHNYSSLMDWHFALGLWKGVPRRWSAIMTLVTRPATAVQATVLLVRIRTLAIAIAETISPM